LSASSTPAGRTRVEPAERDWAAPSRDAVAEPETTTKISSRVTRWGRPGVPGSRCRRQTLLSAAPSDGLARVWKLARALGDEAAAHIRHGLERLAYDPPWAEAAPARARRVW
jgi:hypothetical protein